MRSLASTFTGVPSNGSPTDRWITKERGEELSPLPKSESFVVLVGAAVAIAMVDDVVVVVDDVGVIDVVDDGLTTEGVSRVARVVVDRGDAVAVVDVIAVVGVGVVVDVIAVVVVEVVVEVVVVSGIVVVVEVVVVSGIVVVVEVVVVVVSGIVVVVEVVVVVVSGIVVVVDVVVVVVVEVVVVVVGVAPVVPVTTVLKVCPAQVPETAAQVEPASVDLIAENVGAGETSVVAGEEHFQPIVPPALPVTTT
jgi:hypothetical protein